MGGRRGKENQWEPRKEKGVGSRERKSRRKGGKDQTIPKRDERSGLLGHEEEEGRKEGGGREESIGRKQLIGVVGRRRRGHLKKDIREEVH